MYNSQETAKRIKQLAKEKNILIGDMLKSCDLSINSLNQASDKKGLSSFSLAKIADYLGCSVDYLLGRTDSLNVDNSIKTGNVTGINVKGNTSVNIGTPSKEQDTADLVEMIQELPLVKRAKVITYIDEIKKEE